MTTMWNGKNIEDYGFKLCGSRRMAEKYPNQIKITPNTDWDIYGPFNLENIDLLQQLGFHHDTPNPKYCDDLVHSIWKKDGFNGQVILRHLAHIYTESFEAISAEAFLHRLWKSSPHCKPTKNDITKYFNGLFRLHGFSGNIKYTTEIG